MTFFHPRTPLLQDLGVPKMNKKFSFKLSEIESRKKKFLPTLENREKWKYAFFKISKIEGRKRNENVHFSRLREKFLFLLSIFFTRSRCLVLVLLGVSIDGPETGECLQSSHCSIWQVAEQTLCQWQQSAPRLLRAEEMFSILAARPRFLLFFLLQGASVVILALSGLCLDWRAECLNG